MPIGTLCAFFLFLRVYVPEENDFFVYDVITIGSREIIRKKDCLEMILNHFVTASFNVVMSSKCLSKDS